MAPTDKSSPPISQMNPQMNPQMNAAANQLLVDLFEGRPDPLYNPVAQWVTSSKTFTAFAQNYLSKIRKKARMSRDAEESYNLYCELRTAYLLLQEPKFAVAYEPYGKEQGRSADFAVTFRTNTTFHVEVTRLRISQQEAQWWQEGNHQNISNPAEISDFIRRYESRRLVDVVCDKFTQLLPDTPNLLWVWSESRVMRELDIGEVMLELKRRAEQRDAVLFARYGFTKPAELIRYYQRLSAILVQSLHDEQESSAILWWQNKDSKHQLPAKTPTLIRSLIASDHSQPFGAVQQP